MPPKYSPSSQNIGLWNIDLKKILLISYYFPPAFEVGGLRIAGFAKYLPQFGWQPYVLTIKDRYLEKKDLTRLKGLEQIEIASTCKLPTIRDGYLKLKIALLSLLRKRKVTLEELEDLHITAANHLKAADGFLQQMKRDIIEILLVFPDAERGWIIPAVIRGLGLLRKESIKHILTSGPPQSVHIVGLFLKKLTGVHWSADFRDPWITPLPEEKTGSHGHLSTRLNSCLERSVIRNADLTITTTERLHSKLKKTFNYWKTTKFAHISNGFDSDILEGISSNEKYNTFTITYAGTFYLGRSPAPLFQALKELKEEGKLNSKQLRLKLVGNCEYVNGRPTSQVASQYGLNSMVEVLDAIPYTQVLEVIRKSHLALLLAPDQPYQIPAKAYDYIGVGTQILALAGGGATAELIDSAGGRTVDPSDIGAIKEFIYSLIKNGDFFPVSEPLSISQYERKSTAKALADCLT